MLEADPITFAPSLPGGRGFAPIFQYIEVVKILMSGSFKCVLGEEPFLTSLTHVSH